MAQSVFLEGEIVDDFREFFAPADTDSYSLMVAQRDAIAQQITEASTGVKQALVGDTFHYFQEANRNPEAGYVPVMMVEDLFNADKAIKYLDACSWDKALRQTDVLDLMPQARRDEWNESISSCNTPPFNRETLVATLQTQMAMRQTYFAERVDGIFKKLSRTHATNRPEGFGKRFIMNYVVRDGTYLEMSKVGYINDLRCVIARFMGREELRYDDSRRPMKLAMRLSGEWVTLDGGALRIRIYAKAGTAHLEVHPDMAWRLNCVLASLYPTAIPSQFRERPSKARKQSELMQKPLPTQVVRALGDLHEPKTISGEDSRGRSIWEPIKNALMLMGTGSHDKHVMRQVGEVMEAIGGMWAIPDRYWLFDYDPSSVVEHIIASGVVPDSVSHQIYNTPEALAKEAVSLCEIGPEDECLEPQAGIGGLADHMPKERTTCVEVSALRAKVLEEKGFDVTCADFTKWALTAKKFDRIVMNPPFSQSRWQYHLTDAIKLLKPTGKLVAILPVSARNVAFPGCKVVWHGPYSNHFKHTSISVVIGVFTVDSHG